MLEPIKEPAVIPPPSPAPGTAPEVKVEDLQGRITELERNLNERVTNYNRLERKFTKTSQEKALIQRDLDFVRSLQLNPPPADKPAENLDNIFKLPTDDEGIKKLSERLERIEKALESGNQEKEVATEQERIGKFIDTVLTNPQIAKDFQYFDKELAVNLLINPNRLNALLDALQEDDEEEAEAIIREAARDSHLKIEQKLQTIKEQKPSKPISAAGDGGGAPEIVPNNKKKFYQMSSQERVDSIKGILQKFTKK